MRVLDVAIVGAPANLTTNVKNHSVNHPIHAQLIFYDALITTCFLKIVV